MSVGGKSRSYGGSDSNTRRKFNDSTANAARLEPYAGSAHRPTRAAPIPPKVVPFVTSTDLSSTSRSAPQHNRRPRRDTVGGDVPRMRQCTGARVIRAGEGETLENLNARAGNDLAQYSPHHVHRRDRQPVRRLFAQVVNPVEFPDGLSDRAAAGNQQHSRWCERIEIRPQPRAEPRVVEQTAADLHDDHGFFFSSFFLAGSFFVVLLLGSSFFFGSTTSITTGGGMTA